MTIYCTYCGQGFARNEHLQRHVLTHTDLRPFECPVCHLTFKRRDLMKKHFIAHDAAESHLNPHDAELARSLLAKVRSTAACSNCAQTKTKCDNDLRQPCTRCRSKGLTCAARATRPRGPKPKQARPPQARPPVGADGGRPGEDGGESPAASCGADKETVSAAASTDGEPGPSIHVATSTLGPAASAWSMSSDFSCLATFDMGSSNGVSGTQVQNAFIPTGRGGTEVLSQQRASPTMSSTLQESVSVDQPNVFSRDLFQPVESGTDGSVVYGPSWDLGSTPEQFFHPASEVFGPFLGFPSPANFNPDAPMLTNPSEDVIMGEAEQLPTTIPPSCPVPPPQGQPELRPDEGDNRGNHSNTQNIDDKAMVAQTPQAGGASPLHVALDEDPGASSSVGDTTDPWFLPRDVEHWTMLQCCPKPSSVAPGRAIANLAFLEENSRHSPGPWSVRTPGSSSTDPGQAPSRRPHRVSVSLSSTTRERMSAIAQSFFLKALETHGLGVTSSPSAQRRRASEWFGSSGYVLLPPTEDLEVFLESYMNHAEPYFPLVPTRALDPNELLVASGDEKGATLLLLLMVAIGAAGDPATRARRFGAGLAEVCRISLTDLVEKDNEYSTVPLILQCSLLLTIQSCWGGDKWQMDIGAGHRSMYIAMLKNSGYFRGTIPKRPKVAIDGLGLHTAWRTWVEQEGRRRLAYNWVMLDQELSLFYDQPPTFAVTELRAPLPEADEFWLARSAAEWRRLYDREHGPRQDLATHLALRPQHSLRRLFQLCLAGELDDARGGGGGGGAYRLTPIRLRLLLYPIQGLVFHHSQLLDAFPDKQLHSMSSFKTTARTSSILRLDELQSLLQTWWRLAQASADDDAGSPSSSSSSSPPGRKNHHHHHHHHHPPPPPRDPEDPLARANLVLYHLVSLNLHAGVKAIEGLARGEREREGDEDEDEDADADGGARSMGDDDDDDDDDDARRRRHIAAQCVYAPRDALYHAGQVLRLVRGTPARARPSWWAAAVYRAALVLWAHSVAQASCTSSEEEAHARDDDGDEHEPAVRIDAVRPADAAVARFLRHGRGVPVLTGGAGGAAVRLDDPRRVLRWCVGALAGAEACSWFAMGVRAKLETLLRAWGGSSTAGAGTGTG